MGRQSERSAAMAVKEENSPWPTELRLRKDPKAPTVAFDSGETFDLPAEYLRIKSPSPEVQGHAPEEPKTEPGNQNAQSLEVLPVGNCPGRLVFRDIHSTRIFRWGYLRELGVHHGAYWQDYLDDLAAKGLNR